MAKTWTPPAKLKLITPEAYAGLTMFIEKGVLVAQARLKNITEKGCTKGCTPQAEPPIGVTAEELYQYIPAASIPLPATTLTVDAGGNVVEQEVDELDRPTIVTFEVDRKILLQALDDATPVAVLEQIGDADPNDEGIEWWAVALSGVGVLAWLGKKSWRGAILARIGAGILGWLVAAGIIEELGEAAKQVLDAATKAAKSTLGALPFVLGGAVLVGVGILAWRSSVTSSKQPPRELKEAAA